MHYTRFERARIVGARALQISMGAPILVELTADLLDPLTIALRAMSKRFPTPGGGQFTAVKDISLAVEDGALAGFSETMWKDLEGRVAASDERSERGPGH